MKLKKKTDALDSSAQNVEFPSYCYMFCHFTSELRKIIEANCGRQIASTLEYDESDQTYSVNVKVSGRLLPRKHRDEADYANMTFTRNVPIEPKEPLGPQIEHINKAQEALQDRRDLLSLLLVLQKDGFRMHQAPRTAELTAALKVLLFAHEEHLCEQDPMAVRQALQALGVEPPTTHGDWTGQAPSALMQESENA